MNIFGAILGWNGTQAAAETGVNGAVDVTVYHDGVDYECEVRGSSVKVLSQTEGNTVPDVVIDAAIETSWDYEV